MSLNFFFPEKSPAADVDNAESPRGQPAHATSGFCSCYLMRSQSAFSAAGGPARATVEGDSCSTSLLSSPPFVWVSSTSPSPFSALSGFFSDDGRRKKSSRKPT